MDDRKIRRNRRFSPKYAFDCDVVRRMILLQIECIVRLHCLRMADSELGFVYISSSIPNTVKGVFYLTSTVLRTPFSLRRIQFNFSKRFYFFPFSQTDPFIWVKRRTNEMIPLWMVSCSVSAYDDSSRFSTIFLLIFNRTIVLANAHA